MEPQRRDIQELTIALNRLSKAIEKLNSESAIIHLTEKLEFLDWLTTLKFQSKQ